jgi:Tfp pilus assembly protein PilN
MPYLDLNLAAHPYRRYRTFLLLMVALYLLTAGISWLTYRQMARRFTLTGETQMRVQQLEAGIRDLKAENGRITQSLGAMNFKAIRESSNLVNGLIAQRTFSWSRILETLENVLPEDVRLTFLGTGPDKSGGILLQLSCLSSSRDGMIRTVEALQKEPAFTRVVPLNFQDQETGTPLGMRFDVQALYEGGRP